MSRCLFFAIFVGCSQSFQAGCQDKKDRIDIVNLNESQMSRHDAARLFDHGMRTFGCVILVGHNMDTLLIKSMREQAYKFFALSFETKMKYFSGGYGALGYSPSFTEAVDGSTNGEKKTFDPIESYYMKGDPVEVTEVSDFLTTILAFRKAIQSDVALHTLLLAAQALGLDESAFARANDAIERKVFGVLKLSRYPPSSEVNKDDAGNRYGEHTDWEGFTFLLPDERDDEENGLEILINGEWMSVGILPPDAFIVNAADFVPLWTDNRWKSPTHRVKTQDLTRDRLTIPFFVGPSDSTEIRSLVSSPSQVLTIAGEWLQGKINRVKNQEQVY